MSASSDAKERESGTAFLPKFGPDGLIAAFACDAKTSEPLMVAFMNERALARTLETGEAHFWSRSRQELWHKGATSGNVLVVEEIRVDCDQDALWLGCTVKGDGAACHTGRRSCFYRKVETRADGQPALVFKDGE